MTVLLMVLSLIGLTPAPAHAATYTSSYSELSLPGRANNDYIVVLSGRIWPAAAGRPVSLYAGVAPDGSGGSWVAGANTDSNGRFSFTRTVTSTTRFKFFSAKQVVGTLPFTHGHFEARIKFQRPQGAQGGFWTQSGYDRSLGQAEFDVADSSERSRPEPTSASSTPFTPAPTSTTTTPGGTPAAPGGTSTTPSKGIGARRATSWPSTVCGRSTVRGS